MYERFTDRARKVMQLANEEAKRFNHEYIGTEHILLGLVKEGSGVAANVLKNLGVSLLQVRQEVDIIVQPGTETVQRGKLPQTPRAKKVVEYAIEEARNLKHDYVGSEHLLLGLLREEEGLAAQVLMNLGLKLQRVRDEILNLLGAGRSSEGPRSADFRALDGFSLDLTELARLSKLDPVVGRDVEIERVFQILGRRTRNNPLLIGEPGAGKTAVAHALAQRLAAEGGVRTTPYRRLVLVDCSWCAAGAEDYERFRSAIASIVVEIRTAKDVLLFLDDLHRWDYSPYALAPLTAALTRGMIQCVAAVAAPGETKPPGKPSDPLSCFEPVLVEPLSKAATLPVLAALRGRYAAHHRVEITDEGIQAVLELCDRPAGGRRMPGVAVDVLDEACARVRLRAGPHADPPGVAELDARIARLSREKEEAVLIQDFEKAAACFAEIDSLKREREMREREGNAVVGVVDAAVVAEVVRLMGGRGEPL